MTLTAQQRATLRVLASGIIPADGRDQGALAVHAGERLAEKIEAGANATIYVEGLNLATQLALEKFKCEPAALAPAQVHELVGALRAGLPGFFKQLRMDVSALYLSDPQVWARIGFPGPSTDRGGYPDFDQPQRKPGDAGTGA